MMEEFLIHYGLVAVALVAIVEGDVVFILSGVISHLGFFGFFPAVMMASLGAFLGDTVIYFVGRHRGQQIRASRLYMRLGARAESFYEKLGVGQLFAMRLVFGTRIATLLMCGVRRMSVLRFAVFDYLSCLVWATLLGALGYMLSGSAEWLIGEVRKTEVWLTFAVLASIVLFALFRFTTSRIIGVAPHAEEKTGGV